MFIYIFLKSLENEKTETQKKEFDLVLNNTVIIFSNLIFIIWEHQTTLNNLEFE